MNAKVNSKSKNQDIAELSAGIENEKDLEKMISQQMDARFKELEAHNPLELKELVLFLENRMAMMMVELELNAMLDMKKEEILEADLTEEELEASFEQIQQEVEVQMEASGAFLEMFDELFREKASPKMVELLLDSEEE